MTLKRTSAAALALLLAVFVPAGIAADAAAITAHSPHDHDVVTQQAMQQRTARTQDESASAASDFGDCRQPPAFVVEAASRQSAQTLAQRYADRFRSEQAGNYVRLQPASAQQQREIEALKADRELNVAEEARFEFDGTRGGDPLQFRNDKLWASIRMPKPRALQPAEPVIVAVLDGPVRADHPDFDNVVTIEPRLRGPDGRCDEGDCCPRTTPTHPFWHGTRVAGVIGAIRGNRIGAAGIAPVRTLVSINAAVGGCAGELSLAAALYCAIEYRDDSGRRVKVANISMGSTQPLATTALTTALQRARDENLLVVASAGNKGNNINMIARWPASLNAPNILTVQARRYDGGETKTGNYGFGTVDIGAPAPMAFEGGSLCAASTPQRGNDVCSGDYAPFEQSSAAAAIVTGAAALAWSDRRFAGCSAEQMRALLLTSRRHCITGHSYRDDKDYTVCQLDLDFLSQKKTAALQALCRSD